MKTINFVTPLSIDMHKKLVRWCQITLMMYVVCCTGITIITAYQLMILHRLSKQDDAITTSNNTYASIIKKNTALKNQELQLNEKLETIAHWSAQTEQLKELLHAIYNIAHTQAIIESIIINEHTITIVLLSPQTSHTMEIISSLNTVAQLNNVMLTSLQPVQHDNTIHYRITVHGSIR